MQEKQSTLKKAFFYMAQSKTPNSALIPKVSSKLYLGGVPRKKLIVPQNFWFNSPLGFWGKAKLHEYLDDKPHLLALLVPQLYT